MTTPTLWAAFIRARASSNRGRDKEKFRVLKIKHLKKIPE